MQEREKEREKALTVVPLHDLGLVVEGLVLGCLSGPRLITAAVEGMV